MSYFVTGASGFVGSWVVAQLVAAGAEVRCLVRQSSDRRWLTDLPLHFHVGSLLDPESLKFALKDADYILHIAGITRAFTARDFYLGNAVATENLLAAALKQRPQVSKIVIVSSQAAVGPSPDENPLREDCRPEPISDYGRSKLNAELIAQTYMKRLPITILRPPAVYGPRDADILAVFRNIRRGLNLQVGRGNPLVSMIHVEDLARATLLAAEAAAAVGKTFFVCDDQPYRWSVVAGHLQEIMQRRCRTLTLPYRLGYLYGLGAEIGGRIISRPSIVSRQKIKEVCQPYWTISNAKIRRELNYRQGINLRDGLEMTYNWYRKQRWL